jgi:hypothetical protein
MRNLLRLRVGASSVRPGNYRYGSNDRGRRPWAHVGEVSFCNLWVSRSGENALGNAMLSPTLQKTAGGLKIPMKSPIT